MIKAKSKGSPSVHKRETEEAGPEGKTQRSSVSRFYEGDTSWRCIRRTRRPV